MQYIKIMYFKTCASNIHFEANVSQVHIYLKDLAKFFLTLIIGVFVATITFSEKIVKFDTAIWWSKALLIICWILLLISIVCIGAGIVYLTNWFVLEEIKHTDHHFLLFVYAFMCFVLGGLSFGFALTSMLAAGIISFAQPHVTTAIKAQH